MRSRNPDGRKAIICQCKDQDHLWLDDDDDDDDDDHLLRLDAFLHLLKEVCPRQSNHGRRLMPTFQYQNINVFFSQSRISHHCSLNAKTLVAGTPPEVKCKYCRHFFAGFLGNPGR